MVKLPTGAFIPIGKLNAPVLNAFHLQRERLLDRVCASLSAPVVVVRAAAGFGKSVLMAQSRTRLLQGGARVAWVTLDHADNDVTRLMGGIDAALTGAGVPGQGVSMQSLQGRFAGFSGQAVLFLDEVEHLHGAVPLSFLRELLENKPRQLRVVLGVRGGLDLGWDKLQSRRRLLQLTEADLRFDLLETMRLIHSEASVPLGIAELESLQKKTEGWPVALLFALMTLKRTGDPASLEGLSGSHRDIAEYLSEEVFFQQNDVAREFLLRTSILRELESELCDALCPRSGGDELLQWLAESNLFVVPVEGRDKVYRYHRLFADFLRQRLMRARQGEVARLHLAAAAWYEQAGRYVPAMEHAIEGGDWPMACGLLERCGEELLEQGRLQLLMRLFSLLPEAVLLDRPLLMVLRVWAVCLTAGPEAAMPHFKAAQQHASNAHAHAHLRLLSPVMLGMLDRYEEAFTEGCEVLAHMPSGYPLVDSILCHVMVHISSVLGDENRAQELLLVVRSNGSSSSMTQMYSQSTQGLIDLQAGMLRQALARFRLAQSHATQFSGPFGGNAWAGIFTAYAMYEMQHFEEAEKLLGVHLPATRMVGLPDHLIGAYVMRSRMAFERGDSDSAFQVLFELEHLGNQRLLRRVALSAKLERARILLLQGRAEAARQALQLAEDPELWARVNRLRLPAHETDDLVIGKVRWEIGYGDPKTALSMLATEIEAAQGRRLRWLKLTVLQSLALWCLGEHKQAVDVFEPVLLACCQEGFVRLILDEGPLVEFLLQRKNQSDAEAYDRSDPVLREYCVRLRGWIQPSQVAALSGRASEPSADELTHKELRILSMLAEGFSNQEISQVVFRSESSVRAHLRQINQKLGVGSRAQAIAVARRKGLIA